MVGFEVVGQLINALASILGEVVKARLKPNDVTRDRMFLIYDDLRQVEKEVERLEAFLSSLEHELTEHSTRRPTRKRLPRSTDRKFAEICLAIGQGVERLESRLLTIELPLEIYNNFEFVRSLHRWVGGELTLLGYIVSAGGAAKRLLDLRKGLADLASLRAEMASFLRDNYKLSDL
jgi:hypothetical protein